MTLTVFILVFFSAAIHVFWNALVKVSRDKVSFIWLACVVSSAVLVPAFVVARLVQPGAFSIELVGWGALSGLLEAAYIVALVVAYDRADLSVVYPLSRGVAPLVTLALGGVLLGDVVTVRDGAAVLVVVAGVGGVSWSAWASAPHRRTLAGVGLALTAGCLIAGYHLIDRRAMTLPARPSPLEFLFLMHLFLALFVSAWMAASARRRATAMSEWRRNKRRVLIVGICISFAYYLIMVALRHGNVTHVAAGRNIGIVISTLAGGLLLREPLSWKRAVGAILIVAGVAGLVLLR